MPLYRVVAAYRTDAQEILLVLEHGETIYRVEGDADIVCADLDEARLAHCQGTPRLAPALLLASVACGSLVAEGWKAFEVEKEVSIWHDYDVSHFSGRILVNRGRPIGTGRYQDDKCESDQTRLFPV